MTLTGENNKDITLADARISKALMFSSTIEAKLWRVSKQLTMHHVEDCVTLQPVARALHSNVPHSGGAELIRAKTNSI